MTELWEGAEIEVVGVSGEFASGKTLFGLTIDPVETLVYDFEKSSGSYSGLGVKDRIDWPEYMLKKYPNGYKPIDTYTEWIAHIKAIKPGEYRVIFCDPITDIENGLCDWVKANHDQFGKTAKQYESAGGLFWGDVKSHWKSVLVDIAARCETFVFSTHMRQVWRGNTPTGRREPKGKESLTELASLYLVLERKPNKQTGKVPAKPSAIVLKSRLATMSHNSKGKIEVSPLLPPRIPVATPDAIREYVKSPPNYDKLKVGERVVVEEMSADEKLILEAQIAENQKESEEMRLKRVELAKAAMAKKTIPAAPTVEKAVADKATENVIDVAKAAKEESVSYTEDVKPEPKKEEGPSLFAVQKAILQGFVRLKLSPQSQLAVLKKRGVNGVADLTMDQAVELKRAIWDKVTKQEMENELEK